MKISDRKRDHVALSISGKVDYTTSTGLEAYNFRHNALPEIALNEVDTTTTLLGRTFDFPLFISSMTGGYSEGESVNSIIAEFCEEQNLPFGVGSQRVALEEKETRHSFEIVRKKAPTAFIAANIGGCQLIGGMSESDLFDMIDMIEADAVIVHLNPLQELMQPEGDRNFKGVLSGIQHLSGNSPVPVIVKETGAGISGATAQKLIDIGVAVIDVAGAGGTSWSKVENERRSENDGVNPLFNNWGIPTAQCLREVQSLDDRKKIQVIASGGIRNGFDIIKSLCLGADVAAAAQPVIRAIMENGHAGIKSLFEEVKKQASITMCLLGKKRIPDLTPGDLIQRNPKFY